MSDPTWPGWEPCETCEGSGNFEILNSGFEAEPCLDCAHGFVPPASHVEAAINAYYDYGGPSSTKAFSLALVAAAKAEREERG